MNKSSKKRKRIETFSVIHPYAAGIDISDKEHVVAVGPECCEQNVRTFGSFTRDLEAIVAWLKSCEITSVAMESTGVYWVHLFLLLQEKEFEVFLVNAKHVKNVTGRKDDQTDAAWIQKLHCCGLLNPSFQPDHITRSLRSTERHRKSLVGDASRYLNRIQKALELMNIKLHTVISDIAGKTGQQMLQAILAGERNAETLANLADSRVKASRKQIVKSLEARWKEEHLFELKHCYDLYSVLKEKIKECDQLIEKELQIMIAMKNCGEWPQIDTSIKRKRSVKNQADFNLTAYLKLLTGVDTTKINGISERSALQIVAECGADLSQWKTDKNFCSWLGLTPNSKISGGKLISSKVPKKKHPAGQVFRMAASTLYRSKSPLGHFFRGVKARSGPAQAVVATARKIAVIYYHMIKEKNDFNPQELVNAQTKLKQYRIKRLQKQLKRLQAA